MKYVVIDFDIEGYHYFPGAPEEVDFLQHNHRHLFRIRAHYRVSDSNREKEIFIEERRIKKYLENKYGNPCLFGMMSCEMIAEDILNENNPDGVDMVEVYEDGRGGSIVSI